MATAACSLTGSAYYNNGWLPGSSSYNSIGAVTSYAGGDNADTVSTATYVERFAIPTLNGSFTNCTMTFTFDIVKHSSDSSNLKWGISTVGNIGQSGGSALPTMIASGTWFFSGVTVQHQQFTATTTAINFGSGTSLSGTYYLWVWGDRIVQMYQHASFYTASLTYTDITACSAPTSVSTSATIQTPGAGITLSWSGQTNGVGNTINSFNIQYSDNGTNWYTYASNIGNVSSYTVTIGATRGKTRRFRVQSMGTAGSSYYSGYSSATGNCKTNTLPAAPTVNSSQGIVPSAGGMVTFTPTAGSDSDGQSGSVWYAIGANGIKQSSSGSIDINIVPGSNEIYFWTWDGLEYSASATIKTITINVVPNITNLTIAREELAGQATTNYPLAKRINATATIDKTVTTYTWYYATKTSIGSSWQPANILDGNVASFSLKDISNFVAKGNFYRIGLKVNDGYDDSSTVWETYGGQMPLNPSSALVTSLFNQPGLATQNVPGTSITNFNTGLTLIWTNPIVTSGQCDIALTQIITKTSIDSQTTPSGSYSTTSGQTDIIGDVNLSTLTRGTTVQIGVRVTDTAENTSEVWSTTTMMRAQLPALNQGSLTCNLNIIKPYTNTSDFTLNGIIGSGVNGLVYSFAASFEDKTAVIVNIPYIEENLVTTDVDLTLTIPAATINGILKAPTLRDSTNPDIWNYNYSKVRYRMSVSDNFGNVGDTLYSPNTNYYNVNFIESPVFAAGNIGLAVQYCPDGPIKTVTISSTNNDRMVQAGEVVQFSFTLPTDWNQDIVGYDLLIRRLDIKPSRLGTSYDTYTYEPLQYFNTNEKIQVGTTDVYYFQRTVSPRPINKFSVFALRAVDSKGNYSNLLYSQTYIVECRSIAPTFSVKNLNVTSDTNLLSFSLDIQDLGGSKFEGSGANVYGYFGMPNSGADPEDIDNNYPNFERTITGYTSKADIAIEICKDGNFNNIDPTNYLKTTLTHSGTYSTLYGASKSYSLSGTIFEGQKIYAKVSLILNIGLSTPSTMKTATTIATTVTFYVAAPTVSHRFNHVGINTNSFLDEDIFIVADHTTRRFIRFIGSDTEANQFEIRIDLKTGTIDGAKINGGVW